MIRWAAQLYPATWRARYGVEFDALIDDISPSFLDIVDVVGAALRFRAADVCNAGLLLLLAFHPTSFRLTLGVSLFAHTVLLTVLGLASYSRQSQMPLHVAVPLPPPAPAPPPRITDPRVFPQSSRLYSSVPVAIPTDGGAMPTSVIHGVGIQFPVLYDAWTTDRRQEPERQVRPAQALEPFIVRRVLPEYPRGAPTRGAVSVLVEYLVASDGSVRVLRTSGPAVFADAARSAITSWVYAPVLCEHCPCEAVTRVEVRYDPELAANN